jgi:2,4-dienoyl-CoA reductase-like NADH-dependent reductase (Old Yellow Enzyme family)
LGKRHIAFVCVRDTPDDLSIGAKLREAFSGVYIANQGIDKAVADEVLVSGKADAVAFGQLFIANPDLPLRLRDNGPFNAIDASTFYSPGPVGYTDYPALS